MSILRTCATAIAGVCLLFTAACASTPSYYNPATGARVSVALSGVCSPGQIQDGKSCLCEKDSSRNYLNCTFRVEAKSPPYSQWTYSDCLLQTLVPFQACLSGALNNYGPASVGQLYGASGCVDPGRVYCCPYSGHPLCRVMPQTPQPQYYRRQY